MSYRYAYPNGATAVNAAPGSGYGIDPSLMVAGYPNGVSTNTYNDHRRYQSYSPDSFSSDSESTDGYEYRGRMITRDTRCPRDVVRAPTPPPIIKRVVERAPTPEALVMERVIIRPQAQEIVERVIEQPRTPPPRIIEKEMHEEAPPPIVRTRVIKVDRPLRSGYSQPGSPYSNPCHGLTTFTNIGNGYRAQSIVGSTGRPATYHNGFNNDPSFSSASSFEYNPPAPMQPAVPPQQTMMMMPQSQQTQPMTFMQPQQAQPMSFMQPQQTQPMSFMQPQQTQPMTFMQPQQTQPLGVMQQQQQQPVQQQFMYRPLQMQSSMPQIGAQSTPQLPASYYPQQYMYPAHQGTSYGYRPAMQLPQPGRMIPSGMPMMAATGTPMMGATGTTFGMPTNSFQSQPQMYNPLAQQLVY